MAHSAFASCVHRGVICPWLGKNCAWWAITSAIHYLICPPRTLGEPQGRWGQDTPNHVCLFCAMGLGNILLVLSSWSEKQISLAIEYMTYFRQSLELLLILIKTLWQGCFFYLPCHWEAKFKVWKGGLPQDDPGSKWWWQSLKLDHPAPKRGCLSTTLFCTTGSSHHREMFSGDKVPWQIQTFNERQWAAFL